VPRRLTSLRVFPATFKRSLHNNPAKEYAIFICGGPPEKLSKYGDYGDMMVELLKDKDRNEKWTKFRCMDSEYPNLDELHRFAGYVVTGSAADAHVDDDWIVKLRQTCAQIAADNNAGKLLGICFGHQACAVALGGKSGRSDVGWEVGLKDIEFNEEFFRQFPVWKGKYKLLPMLQSHRDQVSKLPPNGKLLASSGKTKYEMYSVGNRVLCCQGHPEFTEDYVRDLINHRFESGVVSKEVRDEALASLKRDKPAVKVWKSLFRTWLKST